MYSIISVLITKKNNILFLTNRGENLVKKKNFTKTLNFKKAKGGKK